MIKTEIAALPLVARNDDPVLTSASSPEDHQPLAEGGQAFQNKNENYIEKFKIKSEIASVATLLPPA